jgi:hypothetical protein
MNDRFSTDELAALMAAPDAPAVSLYMPAHRVTIHIQEDILQLKNLLKEAGLRTPRVRELLAPAHALLEHTEFWKHQSDGLALFLDGNGLRRYRLPLSFVPQAVTGPRFHIKPLLPLFTNDGLFYVLAVSQNRVRLLQGSRHTVDELAPENIPANLAEALKFDQPEKQLQFHTGSTATGIGRRGAIFFGHGGGATDDDKERILRYFQKIDRGLRDLLCEGRAPLVFAGVDYLLPIYRQANSYPHLAPTAVEGNPDELRATDLHAAAWEIVAPLFAQAQADAVARYHAQAGTGLAGEDLTEILVAAAHGRVDTAFVAIDNHAWGRFDPATGTVTLGVEDDPNNEDLFDLAAVYTWLAGGTVFALRRDEMPDGAPLAAIYRY